MTESTPLVSIITPCYNAEPFLNRCIESIISQTYTNWELILVNDGSTDKTLELCNNFKNQDNRIFIVNKANNEGELYARRDGFKAANGEWIMFVDADDILPSNAIQDYINAADPNNDIIVGSLKDWIMENREISPEEYLKKTIIQYLPSDVWCHFYRAALFSSFVFDAAPLKKGEDLIMNIRLAVYNEKRVKAISNITYNYIFNSTGIVATFKTTPEYELFFHHYRIESIPSHLYDRCARAITLSMLTSIKGIAKLDKSDVSWIGHPFHTQLMESIKYSHFPLTYLEMCWLTVTNMTTRRLINLGLRIDRKLRVSKYDHTLHI